MKNFYLTIAKELEKKLRKKQNMEKYGYLIHNKIENLKNNVTEIG